MSEIRFSQDSVKPSIIVPKDRSLVKGWGLRVSVRVLHRRFPCKPKLTGSMDYFLRLLRWGTGICSVQTKPSTPPAVSRPDLVYLLAREV